MKRIINVGKDFCTYVKTPLIADDVRAYNIVWKAGKEAKGAGLVINAKRSDGVTVTDFASADENGIAEYVLAGNMYSVTGSLEVRLSVVSETSTLTEKVLIFDVISGNGNERIESEDNVPLLTTVLSKASEAIAKAENVPFKISQLENDCNFISEVHNEHIADGAVTPEKTTFYEEMSVLGKNVFLKSEVLEKETFIRDKIEGSAIDRIEICGNSFQNNSIITYQNKKITSGNLTIECKKDGRMILNGSLNAGETVTVQIPEVTFWAEDTYKSEVTLSDESKMGTLSVFAENFVEGPQQETVTSEAIKIVQGSEAGEYSDFEICYRIFEETRSGRNIYPVYCINDVTIKLSGKNRISYDDVTSSGYCSVERMDNGLAFDGRYYGVLSSAFINRLEKGKTYSFSCRKHFVSGTGASNVPRIAIVYEDGTSNQWTLSKPTAVFEGKKIASASLFFSGTANVKCQIADLMFEEGDTVTEYEEYIPDSVISIPNVDLHKIGDISDKLVIGENIVVKRHIKASLIDGTHELNNQNGAASLFAEETIMGYNKLYEPYKNKTVKISLDEDADGVNSIYYYSAT